MARPKKKLLERVLEGSFRPGRYGELLAREPLPAEPPFRDERRRELWHELLRVQRRYCQHADPHDPYYFSRLVRALHGAPLPLVYRRGGVRQGAKVDAWLAKLR